MNSEGSFVAETQFDTQSETNTVALKFMDPSHPSRNLEALVVPEAGSNLVSLKVGGLEILFQPAEGGRKPGLRYGFPILFPTPNRVRDSQFTFDGSTYVFPANERTHFIHGLVHSLPWQTARLSANSRIASVETFLDWDPRQKDFSLFPIRHRISLRFTLDSGGVKLAFSVANHDVRRLPFGFGFHPYFQIISSRGGTYLHVPAQKHMEAIGLLPSGKLQDLENSPSDLRTPVSLERLNLDDVYWGMKPERAPGYEVPAAGLKVTLGASKEFTHMVVYTPPGKPFFCMENQTCSTDAHNLYMKGFERESHLLIADPGQTLGGWVYVKPERTK